MHSPHVTSANKTLLTEFIGGAGWCTKRKSFAVVNINLIPTKLYRKRKSYKV